MCCFLLQIAIDKLGQSLGRVSVPSGVEVALKTTCKSSKAASELGQKSVWVTLNMVVVGQSISHTAAALLGFSVWHLATLATVRQSQ